jgi:hypothetical protein
MDLSSVGDFTVYTKCFFKEGLYYLYHNFYVPSETVMERYKVENINIYEWIAVIFSIGLVFSMELINSAIENTADFISLEKHDTIRKIKDLSAAAVLISALAALIIGLIIFLPKICALCSSN